MPKVGDDEAAALALLPSASAYPSPSRSIIGAEPDKKKSRFCPSSAAKLASSRWLRACRPDRQAALTQPRACPTSSHRSESRA